MIKLVILVIFYIAFPIVIIMICKRWSVMKKLGSIVLAYAFGLLIGSIGFLPEGSPGYKLALQGQLSLPGNIADQLLADGMITESDIYVNTIAAIQDTLSSVFVLLAFPLLLFSLNVRKWLRFAKEGFISMVLALVSVTVIIISGFFIFKDVVPDSWKVAGMLVGLYTGGTPNLVSLKVGLDVDPNLFLMTSTYDMILGAVTIIFFISVGPRIFRAILPPFKHHNNSELDADEAAREAESFDDYSGMLTKSRILPLIMAFIASVFIFAFSFFVSELKFLGLDGETKKIFIILLITTLSIAGSFIPALNRIEKTFQLGIYFILIFSLAVSSMADLGTVFSIGFLGLFLFISYAYLGSLLLHLALSRIFGINADDYLITTTAFVFSPPFVPVVAAAMKNKDVIITGITVGILGYVIGNYLGVGLGYFLKGF